MEITQALQSLNFGDDAVWTGDGLPVVDKMRELTSNAELTREQITAAAPEFSRSNPVIVVAPVEDQPGSTDIASAGPTVEDPNTQPPADAPPPAQAEPVDESGRSRYELLCDQKADAEVELNAKVKVLSDLRDEVNVLQQRVGALNTLCSRARPVQDNQESIMTYIRAGNERRAQKAAAQIKLLKQTGVTPAAINPKSKLDQALNARSNRQLRRPAPRALV